MVHLSHLTFHYYQQMLKKSASGVLASLRGSPRIRAEYASPLRSLRPCWAAFLSILRGVSLLSQPCHPSKICPCRN